MQTEPKAMICTFIFNYSSQIENMYLRNNLQFDKKIQIK